jgi:DNA-binding response OmpR family regulator
MKADEKNGYFLEYQPKYRKYHLLMQQRIVEILLVSSIYDSFIMEEDVRLSDQIYEEFHNLNLRTMPHITRASSVSQALGLLKERKFDLVITMRRIGELDPSVFAKRVKRIQNIPVILLLNNSTEIQYLRRNKALEKNIDKVFVWNGNSNVFVAIIKLLEDRLNVDEDTAVGDVRVIIVVEDSIRFYSLYLPALYSEIMHQTHRLIQEGRNDYHSLLQMGSRQKILLASTYEEAIRYYGRYKDHLLGMIIDIKFPRNGILDDSAGFDLARVIRKEAPTLPMMFQSSNDSNREESEKLEGYFVNKNDRSLIHSLRNFTLNYMGFGPFTFRLPNNEIVAVAHTLFELRETIESVPQSSLVFHAQNDHFSGWLSARGEFEMADSARAIRHNRRF